MTERRKMAATVQYIGAIATSPKLGVRKNVVIDENEMTRDEITSLLDDASRQAREGKYKTIDEVRQILEGEFGIKI